jgi:hypothetical protein
MFQQLIPLLGSAPNNITLFLEIASILAVFGLGLWLLGARYSRQIVTLGGVAVGTIVGKHLPDFALPQMSAPVLAILGAIICGVAAYITHRLWIGLGLGLCLAWWAALGTWALAHGDQSWSQPVWDADMTFSRFAVALWTVLPADVSRILPWATGVAMVSGIAICVLWPRLATALNWSLAGLTLLLTLGMAAMSYERPEWISLIPSQTWMQMTALCALISFGVMVQSKLTQTRSPHGNKPAAPPTA